MRRPRLGLASTAHGHSGSLDVPSEAGQRFRRILRNLPPVAESGGSAGAGSGRGHRTRDRREVRPASLRAGVRCRATPSGSGTRRRGPRYRGQEAYGESIRSPDFRTLTNRLPHVDQPASSRRDGLPTGSGVAPRQRAAGDPRTPLRKRLYSATCRNMVHGDARREALSGRSERRTAQLSSPSIGVPVRRWPRRGPSLSRGGRAVCSRRTLLSPAGRMRSRPANGASFSRRRRPRCTVRTGRWGEPPAHLPESVNRAVVVVLVHAGHPSLVRHRPSFGIVLVPTSGRPPHDLVAAAIPGRAPPELRQLGPQAVAVRAVVAGVVFEGRHADLHRRHIFPHASRPGKWS